MKIKVNGKDQEFNQTQIGLIELLQLHKVTKPELVSVQLNSFFVKREAYQETSLNENDEIDFLYFMGGGSHSTRNI
jgi:sulfur carrier protein